MYSDEHEAFVLNLYNQVEGILLYYDLTKWGHWGPNYCMIPGNDNHAPTQADHLWPDFHADGDSKAPFYRVSEGVFMFQLTRPVGSLVILVYEDEQIEAIHIVKEKPIMHLSIGPAQASRSETPGQTQAQHCRSQDGKGRWLSTNSQGSIPSKIHQQWLQSIF